MNSKINSIYVVFFSTDCKIGKFIRGMTRNKYNHVSLALSDDIQTLYSFARYYEGAPFYAGFVEESLMRYQHDGLKTDMKVCKLDVTDEQLTEIRETLEAISLESRRYIYNYASAIGFLAHKKINIQNAYTCVDFVVSVLASVGVDGIDDGFTTIRDLEERFSNKVVFEGDSSEYSRALSWGNDTFENLITRRRYVYNTAKLLGSLFYRAFAHGM